MTTAYGNEAGKILARWADEPPSRERLSATEEAVRLADKGGDDQLRFAARLQLVDAAGSAGQPHTALVALAWCMGRHQEDPDRYFECQWWVYQDGGAGRYSSGDLFWRVKHVIARLGEFPGVTSEQIEDVFEQATAAHRRRGRSPRSIHEGRCRVARLMGRMDEAAHWFRIWTGAPRDSGSDCEVCELDEIVEWHLFVGEVEVALREARPILDGRMECRVVPHVTLANFLVPVARLGKPERAVAFHQRGYPLVRSGTRLLSAIAQHLRFLVLTENLAKGLELFRDHATLILDGTSPLSRFWGDLSSWTLFTKLTQRGEDRLHEKLPKALDSCRTAEGYDSTALRTWFEERMRGAARAFDARNGNDRFARHIAEGRDLVENPVVYPL